MAAHDERDRRINSLGDATVDGNGSLRVGDDHINNHTTNNEQSFLRISNYYLSQEETRATGVPRESPPNDDNAPPWNPPCGRNRDFVGRQAILKQLRERIPPKADLHDCQRVAIEGLGGVGKTQIALEVAFQLHVECPDCFIFWVPAVDAATFENAYRGIGGHLKIPGIDEDTADVKTLVREALSQNPHHWLLIIDNADDPDLLTAGAMPLCRHLPFSLRGSILFTSRNHVTVGQLGIRPADVICVTEMSRSEAEEMLEKSLDETLRTDSESTAKLLDCLTDLPLAIKQASAYMDNVGMTTTKYLDHYLSSDKTAIELLSKDFNDPGRYYQGIQNPVATTWLISFRHISRYNPLAAQYLQFISFLAEKDIPSELLPPGEGGLQADEAIGLLKSYAFITEQHGQSLYQMHRLVRLAMQNWLAVEGDVKTSITRVIKRLNDMFPDPDHQNKVVWIRYLPHALTALEQRDDSIFDASILNLLCNVSESTFLLGKYSQAETMCRQTVELYTKGFGPEHPNTILGMTSVARSLYFQGNHQQAEILYLQTLELYTKALGAGHPNTLTSLNNLANLLLSQGKPKQAEVIYKQILELQKKALGIEYPQTLASINNLASSLDRQGNHQQAEVLYNQTLELRKKVLGTEHPHTLMSMDNLATLLSSQGKHQQAEILYKQTLELQKKVLGIEHPNTLISMNNLANSLYVQRKHQQAEILYKQTLELQKKVLGIEHPNTLISINNLEGSLCMQGKYQQGEILLIQALSYRRKR